VEPFGVPVVGARLFHGREFQSRSFFQKSAEHGLLLFSVSGVATWLHSHILDPLLWVALSGEGHVAHQERLAINMGIFFLKLAGSQDNLQAHGVECL